MTGTTQSRVPLESTTLATAGYNEHRCELQLDFRDGARYQTPQCHHICFTTCLPPLPRDLSSIVTSAAVSIMLNLRSKTKWHCGFSLSGRRFRLPTRLSGFYPSECRTC